MKAIQRPSGDQMGEMYALVEGVLILELPDLSQSGSVRVDRVQRCPLTIRVFDFPDERQTVSAWRPARLAAAHRQCPHSPARLTHAKLFAGPAKRQCALGRPVRPVPANQKPQASAVRPHRVDPASGNCGRTRCAFRPATRPANSHSHASGGATDCMAAERIGRWANGSPDASTKSLAASRSCRRQACGRRAKKPGCNPAQRCDEDLRKCAQSQQSSPRCRCRCSPDSTRRR